MCWFRLKQIIIKFIILYNYSVAPLIHIKGYEDCLLFTWANGEKYSGLVISFQNSVYHLHKSLPFTEKLPLKPETSIKDEKADESPCSEHSVWKNSEPFTDVPLLPDIFHWNDMENQLFHLLF